jgi:hypothetical protein
MDVAQYINSSLEWQAIDREILSRIDLRREAEGLGVRFARSTCSPSGWLSCHSISREDSNPSAAVCLDSSSKNLGKYSDRGDGKQCISFWELAVATRKFIDWRDARAHFASIAGIELPNRQSIRKMPPTDQVAWRKVSENATVLPIWASHKPGITVEAAIRAGAQACYWPKQGPSFSCVGFRSQNQADWTKATGVILYRQDGLDFPEQFGLPARKTHTVGGSVDGWILVAEPDELAAATHLWKCEGLPDALSLASRLPTGHVAITNICGAGARIEPLASVGKGKTVVVVHDRDRAGEDGARRAARDFHPLAKEVLQARLPYDLDEKHGKDLRDFFNEGHSFGELWSTVKVAAASVPEINARCQELRVVTQEAWEAIEQGNEPRRLFVFGGRPVRVERGEHGEPTIRPLDNDRMRYEAARAAKWYQLVKPKDGGSQTKAPAMPPMSVVKDMLAAPAIPLPILTRIVEAPAFASDGTLQIEPGYHAASRTFFSPAAGFIVPNVPDHPDAETIAEAVELIQEPLADFPFATPADKANAISAMLLPFARDLIDGPTPLFLVEKPCPGTGATLLLSAICYPFTGRDVESTTEGRDEDEWRKRITAKLRGAPQFLSIDNLKGRLDSAAVASVLTARVWEDRLLGASETLRMQVRTIFFATGNNPSVSTEIGRRTISIRIDARTDRPWLRTTFTHSDLLGWLRESRPRLAWACLVVIRAWIIAGKPMGNQRLGMYESWSGVMGGILENAGVKDFLGNLARFYDAADEEGVAWRCFMAGWWQQYGENEKLASELYAVAREAELNLGDGNDASQRTRLCKAISKNRDRIFSVNIEKKNEEVNLQIVSGGTVRRSTKWKLVKMDNPPKS